MKLFVAVLAAVSLSLLTSCAAPTSQPRQPLTSVEAQQIFDSLGDHWFSSYEIATANLLQGRCRQADTFQSTELPADLPTQFLEALEADRNANIANCGDKGKTPTAKWQVICEARDLLDQPPLTICDLAKELE